MKELLVVIDMQNDFVTGSLGTKEACGIVDNVKNKIEEYVRKGRRLSLQEIHIQSSIRKLRRDVSCRWNTVSKETKDGS